MWINVRRPRAVAFSLGLPSYFVLEPSLGATQLNTLRQRHDLLKTIVNQQR